MKAYISILFLFIYVQCLTQSASWQISAGIGVSGVDKIISNNTDFYNKIKFNRKVNLLDNKYSNTPLHSGYISISNTFNEGFFKKNKISLTLALYNFRSAYFKEDKFGITFPGTKNDTINSPNWLLTKYKLPYVEFEICRIINFNKLINIELDIFISYQIDYYGTSQLILFDALYQQFESNTFASAKEYTNFEFNHINYGLRSTISIFPEKRIHPIFRLTQSLMDISKEKFHLNQHANIWAINAGLCYNFKSRANSK